MSERFKSGRKKGHNKGILRARRAKRREEAQARQANVDHNNTKKHRLGKCNCKKEA